MSWTSRPAAYAGAFLTAAAWEAVLDELSARGVKSTPATTSSDGTATGAGASTTEVRDTVLGNYVFTAEGSRYYEIEYPGIRVGTDTADLVSINIRDGGASTPTTSSTVVATGQVRLATTGGSGETSMEIEQLVSTFTPGTHTLGAFIVGATAAGVRTPKGTRSLYVKGDTQVG